MRPLTDTQPKPLFEVRGRALIEYHLQALSRAGIRQVVINLCWLGEQIRDRLGNGGEFDLEIEYSEEAEALETAGGIIKALPDLGQHFIVVNADIFTDYDFSRLIGIESQAHLVLAPNPPQHPEGDFGVEANRLRNHADELYTFTGIAAYQASFFDNWPVGKQPLAPGLRKAAEQDLVTAEIYQGEWRDIGTVERLQQLQREYAE